MSAGATDGGGPGTPPPLGPLRPRPVLRTDRLDLEPLGPEHLTGTWELLEDVPSRRLTGTTATFTHDQVQRWLAGLDAADDRLDWAVVTRADGRHVGEVVLNDLDAHNRSMSLRIGLVDAATGHGYGPEAIRAVLDHAFEVVLLHRVELEVYAFNPRAQRTYERCGFVVEGRRRDALWWDAEWTDALLMSVLATDRGR
ncbi:GNAT family N-acetyltransferase [Cellulomonas marina]|uniref:Protein N-acetyltransferase, RimJ/RimL family n=1 Tax=Cellulomonas marina TaxID=988821 RepID=A0A1I1AMG1_9CELL|nr:GNAT family protein [Cellulomonas marina]GIG30444.1 acetyltransferase [Cellulomonas marina]SFB39127.1 Protein N-acetyltransferase, RimJ/RimL family [Cellulomonas marina]